MENEGIDKKEIEWYNRNDSCEGTAFFQRRMKHISAFPFLKKRSDLMKKGIYEFMTYFPFLKEIIKRDFKKKYYKSVLGVAWSMLSPLLMMIVITIVFSTLFRRSIPHYAAYWFSGNMLFSFVFEGSTAAMGSMVVNASLVKKMRIPNYFFCISSVTQHFITMVLSVLPYFIVCLVIGVPMSPMMLLIPLPLILAYFFTLGLGMLLCAYGTFLRDLSYLYHVLRRVWLYITPIFYPIDIIPEQFRFLWDLNPVYVYISIFRSFALNGEMPSEKMLIIGTCYAVLMLALGAVTFKEKEDRFFLYI